MIALITHSLTVTLTHITLSKSDSHSETSDTDRVEHSNSQFLTVTLSNIHCSNCKTLLQSYNQTVTHSNLIKI